jgi:hypothetical protein
MLPGNRHRLPDDGTDSLLSGNDCCPDSVDGRFRSAMYYGLS